MSIKSLDSIIPPVRFKLDGCTVTIYEVLKSVLVSGKVWYHICLDLEYKGKRTRRFSLDAYNNKDFKKRLLVEISKLKWAVILGENP